MEQSPTKESKRRYAWEKLGFRPMEWRLILCNIPGRSQGRRGEDHPGSWGRRTDWAELIKKLLGKRHLGELISAYLKNESGEGRLYPSQPPRKKRRWNG